MAAEADPRLTQIVAAIADGSPVDWNAERAALSTTDILPELRVIAEVAAVHRQFIEGDGERSLGDVLSSAPSRPDHSKGVPWGPLLILDEVGGGAFGRVFRAWDPALDHEVALKRLRLPAGTPPSQAASIVREGQLLARVRHQNVITVHGACEINGEVGIWMEFVRGKTLEQIVQDDGPMSAEEASVVGESLCRALAAVHQAGLLHRDVKASNIMREAGGRIVMLDFGSTREIDPVGARGPHRLGGTPLYLAPELFDGSQASVQSDIYSLGVLLFYLTTRTYPVKGGTLDQIRLAHLTGARRLLSDVRPDLPRGFVKLIDRALSPQPEARQQTAGMLLAELKESPAVVASRSVSSLWIGSSALAIIVVPFLAGLLTSLPFNAALGRVGGFAEESVTAYWVHGFNALFAPLVYMFATTLAIWFALAVGNLGPRQWINRARSFGGRMIRRSRHLDQERMIDALILGQLIVLVVLCLVFTRLLYAALYAKLSDSNPDTFNQLRTGSANVRHAYRISFSITILAMAAAWATVIRGARTPVNRAAVTAGIGLIGIAVFLLVVPYRMTWKNEGERVEFEGTRCYITGTDQQNVLLYCPDAAVPKVMTVRHDDPLLKHMKRMESIFSPQ